MVNDKKDDRRKTSTSDDSWEVVFEQADDAPRTRRLSDQERTVLARLLTESAAAH